MVSIKEFFELREAGYSVDQIKEYSSFMEQPVKDPAPDPKPEPKPEPKPDPVEAAAKAGSAQLPKDPTEEQLKDVNDTLKNLIGFHMTFSNDHRYLRLDYSSLLKGKNTLIIL